MAGVGLLIELLALVVGRSAFGDCGPVVTGVDTTGWNGSKSTYLGEAVGQTFFAADTLIGRITVWRPPSDVDGIGSRLFVTTVDTVNYDPPRPITQGIIQSGPVVFVRDADPPGSLIRMDFILNPPLALPYRGTFAFFIQREGCDLGETILIAKRPGPYPDGTYWLTGRTAFLPCFLRSVIGWEDLDLCFEIEFCRDTATPVLRESWGHLKVIFR